MKDIQQLIKKNNQDGRYKDIFPKTFLDAVKDRQTGVALTDILSGFNMYFLSYVGSSNNTRLQVPKFLRKTGLWITYVRYDKTIVTEWYASDDISDKAWGLDSNWRIGSNMLVGDITISSEGNWIVNGVDTGVKAQGEQGITPLLRIYDNKLQVSYTNGASYIDVNDTPVYTKFREEGNKLQQSTDLGKTWVTISDYIAAWFRWVSEEHDTAGYQLGKIQISRNNGNTWTDFSGYFTNNLHIKGYVSSIGDLPSSAALGDIYGVGPTYDTSDTEHTNPIYRLYVKTDSGWVDNGQFTSISAGVVQELGDSETAVVSQKKVTEEFAKLNSSLFLLGSTNFVKDCYNPDTNENISLSATGTFRENSVFDYIGKSAYFSNSATGLLDCRYNLRKFPKLSGSKKIHVIAELNILDNPVGGNVQVRILKNGSDIILGTEKQYVKSGRFIYNVTFNYSSDIDNISIFIIRYKEPATVEIGRVYIGLDSGGSLYGDYNIYNETKELSKTFNDTINKAKIKLQNIGTYNFINPFDIVSTNCNIQNGINKDNTLFNYNGKMCEFVGNDSSVTDSRIILHKLPDDVRIGSKLKVIVEVFAENLPENMFVEISVISGNDPTDRLNVTKIYNGYTIYEVTGIEVTEKLKNINVGSLHIFMPIQTFAYPGKIVIGRVYIGYDSTGSIIGDYNVQQDIKQLIDNSSIINSNIQKIKLNNSNNFLVSCTDINKDNAVGILNGEVLDNTKFNYIGKMIKFGGGETLKDCRFFLQYIPDYILVGQKLKILVEVYVENTTYANFRPLVANEVGSTTTLKQGYNIYEVNNIEVTNKLKESKIGALGVFIPLQAGDCSVYIGRVYLGMDGEGSIVGDTNLENRISTMEQLNIKEKLDFLSNALSPTILVSPNESRFIIKVNDNGSIIVEPISCKKILYLGNSFVIHSADESKGWTPSEPWGMAAETKEKDFVHRLNSKISNIVPSTSIASIINIVPWEGNTHGFDKTQLDYIQDIDFDCVVFRVGENVNEWDDFDTQAIDLLDNHILAGKNNIPVFVSSMFSVEAPTNSISSKNEVLKNIANHYHTPFSYIGVNTGTPNNIYNAVLSPLPPKPDGTPWDKSEVLQSVLYGHPGNIGHEYIAEEYFNSIKLYYRY